MHTLSRTGGNHNQSKTKGPKRTVPNTNTVKMIQNVLATSLVYTAQSTILTLLHMNKDIRL